MRSWLFASCTVLIGCGSVSEQPKDAAVDSAVDVPRDVAVDTPAPRCNPTAPFGSGTPVAELNSPQHDNFVWLTSDELTAYLSSQRTGGLGGYDIYVATRTSKTAAFGTPQLLSTANTAMDESRPSLSSDGLTLYAAQAQSNGQFKIVSATRTSTTAAFGAFSLVVDLNTTSVDIYDADPELAANGTAYFSSTRGGNADLYAATKNGTGFNGPLPVSASDIASPSFDGCVVISPDELTIFFCSNRTGGAGAFDMYMSQRSSVAVAFPAVTRLATLSSASNEQPSWISADGCLLYYSTGTTQNDIYVAQRGM
ncbi:MAG TPA: hypothetical protein VMZ53_27400 [Kofleriaceae bacterium]|nr:hypothetical protein [Kofleriaceae bacterium]